MYRSIAAFLWHITIIAMSFATVNLYSEIKLSVFVCVCVRLRSGEVRGNSLPRLNEEIKLNHIL